MKPGLSLPAKILLTAAVNFVLLAFAALALTGFLRGLNSESIFMAMAREKIVATAGQIALDLAETAPEDRTALLARYSAIHGVTFLLFLNDGEQLAGPAVTLPEPVRVLLTARPPGDRPPPFEGPPPGKGKGKGPPKKGPITAPFLIVTHDPSLYWVGVRVPVRSPGVTERERGTLFIRSNGLFTSGFFFDWRPWIVAAAVILTTALICWLPLLRGITRTIHQLTEATARVARGEFDVRVETGRRDELGRLGESIHQMANQLEAYVHGQKRFLRDAAHELRSPLARMQMAAAILERKSDESAAPYLADLKEEIDLMSGLTTQLLSLARAESKPDPAALGPVNLREVAERATRTELTTGADVRVEVDPAHTVIAESDALYRSLSNLVRNAIRYAGSAGPITVSSSASRHEVAILVADRGPGIPESAMAKVFTPFFRLEDARDRQTGGTGLGMAIAKAGAEACGGTIECRNRDGGGLEVVIRLRRAG